MGNLVVNGQTLTNNRCTKYAIRASDTHSSSLNGVLTKTTVAPLGNSSVFIIFDVTAAEAATLAALLPNGAALTVTSDSYTFAGTVDSFTAQINGDSGHGSARILFH